jgi:hypothetical protein
LMAAVSVVAFDNPGNKPPYSAELVMTTLSLPSHPLCHFWGEHGVSPQPAP